MADGALGAGRHVLATSVSDGSRREHRRASPQQSHLAVSPLPADHQRLCVAHRRRRTHHVCGRGGGCRQPGAFVADGGWATAARTRRLHRWALGGRLHGHRRHGGAGHDGLERRHHSTAPPHPEAAPGRTR